MSADFAGYFSACQLLVDTCSGKPFEYTPCVKCRLRSDGDLRTSRHNHPNSDHSGGTTFTSETAGWSSLWSHHVNYHAATIFTVYTQSAHIGSGEPCTGYRISMWGSKIESKIAKRASSRNSRPCIWMIFTQGFKSSPRNWDILRVDLYTLTIIHWSAERLLERFWCKCTYIWRFFLSNFRFYCMYSTHVYMYVCV